MNKSISIGNHLITERSSTYVIAEMSGNHNQDYERAERIVHAAKDSGADAIKIQTYTADTMTLNCDNACFQITQGTLWDGTTLHKLYEKAYTPWEWQPRLQKLAHELGLDFFSTAFDSTSVDFLEKMNVPAYKIASFEITDVPLIRKIAKLGKPIIISTGIANLSDIELAIQTCLEAGNDSIILLKCCSEYPTPYENMNLKTMQNMQDTFDCVVGLSDHTMGFTVAVASVAMGAKIVEKHLTLDRKDGGVDSAFSMEPNEFKQMVEHIRIVEKAIGKVTYELSDNQRREREHARSLFISHDIKAGEVLTVDNLASIRPFYGLHTKYYDELIGKRVRYDLKMGTPVSWDLIDFSKVEESEGGNDGV